MPQSVTELSKDLVRRMPPRLQARVRDLARPGRGTLVSIVVPVYNVERYIEECLVSILNQTHRKIEVIVVDDGSPDDSIAIAERIAARDRRVKIVRQQNQGLGPARNTGVRHARGELLAFVDSDDELHPRAMEAMVAALTHSKSDFAVGGLIRRTPAGDHTPKWVRQVHYETRLRRTVAQEPDVLKNVFAWTKVYRLDFFKSAVGEFPAGAYEDQVPAAKAYLAGTFDIVRNRIVYWRSRDDATSITQQKADLADLEVRWNVIRGIEDVMKSAPEAIRATFEAKAIGFDMRPYFEQIPRTEPVYWETLRANLRDFVDDCGYERLRDVPVADRLLAAATYHGHAADVAELISRREVRTWSVPGRVVDGKPVVADEYFDGLALERDEVIGDLSADVRLVQRIAEWRIGADSAVVTGVAFPSGIDLRGAEVSFAIELRSPGAPSVSARVENRTDDFVDRWSLDAWNSARDGGFSATFSLADLDQSREYSPWLSVTVDGLTVDGRLEAPDPTGAGILPIAGAVDESGRWTVATNDKTGLVRVLHRKPPYASVSAVTVSGTTVVFDLHEDTTTSSFLASRGASLVRGVVDERDGTRTLTFELPPPSGKSADERKWRFAAVGAAAPHPLGWSRSSSDLATEVRGAGLVPVLNARGEIAVLDSVALCSVSSIEVLDDGVHLRGWAIGREGATEGEISLASDFASGTSVTFDVLEAGTDFHVVLPILHPEGAPLSKDYGFTLTYRVGDAEAPVRLMPAMTATLPADLDGPTVALTVTATAKARSLWLRFRSLMAAELSSRFAQEQLLVAYRKSQLPLSETVLFESFGGTALGDSPLALSRELHAERPDLHQLWSVACLTTTVPEWATPVVRFSPEWYDALATSRYLVNNNNWPWFFVKREGQRYIQTWHGTPLKRIGYDVPQGNLSLTYRRLMVREAAAWDFLLAQNDFAAQTLPRAFGYEGDVLNVGYPRNDALVADSADSARAVARERFGIPDGTRAILYAPTWRDNIVGARGYGLVSFLDVEELMAAAAADGVPTVILYRGHFNTLRAGNVAPEGVINVSGYPDVNDVMLASDALVTDYSSIMFDYAVMGRPIYLLVPDLDLYSSKTRGFYMDFEEIAPGPLCADTGELIGHLRTESGPEQQARYSRFVADFAPRDDGHAAERVIAAAMGDGPQ